MRAPARYRCLEAVGDLDTLAAEYPGHGFFATAYFALGNGDRHGLYWAIGREAAPPILCEMFHDEWSLDPHSSSIEGFLQHVAEARDWEEDDSDREDWSDLCRQLELSEAMVREYVDERSPSRLYQQARACLARQDIHGCIAALESALEVLPEYGKASSLLASQYRREGRLLEAAKMAVQCITSPPMFGGEVLTNLASLRGLEGSELDDDPVWQNRSRLTKTPSGEKENETYRVMDECIAAYLGQGNGPAAIRLRTAWGQRMARETHSFRERYGCVGDYWPALLTRDLGAAGVSERITAFDYASQDRLPSER